MPFLTHYYRIRIVLAAAALICFGIFWQVGAMFGIPVHPGYEASLLQQPSVFSTLLIVAVVLGGCVALTTVLTGWIRFNAGLATAALGLSALSFRGGSGRYTLFWGLQTLGSPKLFWVLMVETLILGLFIGVCWWGVRWLYLNGRIKDHDGDALGEANAYPARHELPALGVQMVGTAFALLLLVPVEDKQQAVAGVFIAALAGAIAPQFFFPTGPRAWYWLPPLVVGVFGYAWAWHDPAGLATGHLTGPLAALARPLPLDYASAGSAGAVIGHWLGRRWAAAEDQSDAAPDAAAAQGR